MENGKDIDVGNPFFVVLISKLMDKLSVDFSAKYKSIEVTKIPDELETSNICAIGLEYPVLNIVLLINSLFTYRSEINPLDAVLFLSNNFSMEVDLTERISFSYNGIFPVTSKFISAKLTFSDENSLLKESLDSLKFFLPDKNVLLLKEYCGM